MSASDPTEDERTSFADRYALLGLEDGGVLVDLESGTYLALNVSAAAVCATLATTTHPIAVVTAVSQQLRIGRDDASRAVAEVRKSLEARPPRNGFVGAFRYERAPNGTGYVLLHEERVQLEIAEDGSRVEIVPGATPGQLYEYLRAAAPKILFLRGAVVLHGSAVRVADGLRAICGASGAGKTTTGRAFGATGLTVVSEDLLVVASLSPPSVYTDGERIVHGWAREVSKRIAAGGVRTVDTSGLGAALSGGEAPIREVWFIEASRRHELASTVQTRRLSKTEGAIAFMSSIFLGAASPSGWRRFLSAVDTIASATPIFEAAMPNGLARLEAAVRAYKENSAS